MSQIEALQDLPPSAKLVYKVLEYDGPLTQKQLVDETMLAPRTVRYAIERLENVGTITETIYIEDARQTLYKLDRAPDTAHCETTTEACTTNSCS